MAPVQVYIHTPTGATSKYEYSKGTRLVAVVNDALGEVGLPATKATMKKIRLLKDGHEIIADLSKPLSSVGVKCVGRDSGSSKWNSEVGCGLAK